MGDQWYCNRGSKRFGPFSPAQLKQLARDGKLRPTDLLWKEGMPQPVPAGRAGALFPNAAAEKQSGGGEASSMPRPVATSTPASPAADRSTADAPPRPDAGNEQTEFLYRNSLRKAILAMLVCVCAGVFFAYMAISGHLDILGIALPDEIGKPILWAFVLLFILAPLQGVYFFIRDRSNPRRIAFGPDRLMVPQTNVFNRARSIPYASISAVRRINMRGIKAISIRDAKGKVELVAGLLPKPADLDAIQLMLEQRLQRR